MCGKDVATIEDADRVDAFVRFQLIGCFGEADFIVNLQLRSGTPVASDRVGLECSRC
jgi:hypothetical protein